jgi:hypothetical protein
VSPYASVSAASSWFSAAIRRGWLFYRTVAALLLSLQVQRHTDPILAQMNVAAPLFGPGYLCAIALRHSQVEHIRSSKLVSGAKRAIGAAKREGGERMNVAATSGPTN